MTRRRETTVPCRHPGCGEHALYWRPTRDELRDLKKRGRQWSGDTWLCKRHVSPGELLTSDVTVQVRVLHVLDSDVGHFFYKNAEGDGMGRGVVSGPGFKAIAEDLPVGAQLRITAELVLL